MNRKLRDKLILVATCLALCIPSFGQVLKGSISGTVTDPQGAVVSGAQVKATQIETGSVLTTTSDSSGSFRFNLIPAGTYKVEVSAQGFKTSVNNNILVSAGRDSGLGAMKLSVGEASTTVEVTADAPLIETTQSQVTNTFAGTQLTTFAGVQENEGLDNLALFVPGVVSARDNGFSNTNGGGGFAVNGLRGRNNDQQIDGQNNNDNSVAGPGLFLSDTEFVQQYIIITDQFGPEYGRNAGSVVNIITKSGTNAWHGSIYGTESNSILNSMTNTQKQFDNLKHPPRLQDEFTGFTIGGPMVKNKLFMFGGFDDEIITQHSTFTSGGATPTPAGLATLAGCFPGSQTLSTFSTIGPFGISAGNPTPINSFIDTGNSNPALDDPNALAPGCTGVEFAQVTRSIAAPVHQFNFVSREDLQLGSDTVTARYIFNRGNFFNLDECTDCGAAGYPTSVPALSQAALLGWTHNFNSKMVNELRGSFGRLNVLFGGNTIGTMPTQVDQAVTRITFSAPGLLAVGPATNLPQFRIVNTYQAQDNFNYVLGKHQLKAGVNYTYQVSPNGFLPAVNGSFRFDNWSAFALNSPNNVNIAAGSPAFDLKEHDTFLYAGDDWKFSQHLTLNLGLTWSYYGQPANLFNDITTARETNPATALFRPDAPLSVRTYPRFPTKTNAFGPSVGFAYSPQWGGFLTGSGKTVIRGGYRLLYDPPFYNIYSNMATAAPEVFSNTFNAVTTPPASSLQLPAVPTGPNVRAELNPQLLKGVFDPRTFNNTSLSPDFGPDMVHSYSLGIEREVSKNSAVELRYVGNHAVDLFQSINGNPFIADLAHVFPNLVPAGVTPCTTPQVLLGPGQTKNPATGRENCALGVTRLRTNGGFSNYNGFQAEFRANNLFKQLTIRAGYTFSKNLDNVSEIFSTGAGGATVAFAQNPFAQSAEYSISGLNIPHQFTILFSEEFPMFKEQHGLVGHILGGWGISGNYVLASGQPYTASQFAFNQIGALRQCGTSGAANCNFFDSTFFNGFIGVETDRPFVGNINAPVTSVGIFCGDILRSGPTGPDPTGSLACGALGFSRTDLLSLNALNTTSATANPFVKVSPNDVRYIANTGIAEQVFGTPFGNAPRNGESDAITNIANASLYKKFKLGEHASFEFHATALNVFNHINFQSIDPFIEDAIAPDGSNRASFTGFGDPSVTGSVPPGFGAAATRRILVGGTIRF
ncbi:MAG TPA: carboxypeptidase regulatory-like domain-containing protein [Candidatus Angelobacter sp.]|nr:carboxypeptidase regulatory-like domain-containing protein [Candidatus Angelobacter sp.]